MPGGSMVKPVERSTRIFDMLWYSAYLYDIAWSIQLYTNGKSIVEAESDPSDTRWKVGGFVGPRRCMTITSHCRTLIESLE